MNLLMKRLLFVSLCALIAFIISAQVFGAGFFEQGTGPPGGYPSSPTFVHVGTASLTATDNITGTGTTDLKNFRDAYITNNIIGSGGAISGYKNIIGDNTGRVSDYAIGAAGFTDNGFFNVVKYKDGPAINPVGFGADNSGVTDTTATLQSAVNAGNIVDLGKGTYKITSLLSRTFADGDTFVFRGDGATIDARTVSGTAVRFQGSVGASAALGGNANKGDLVITCALSVSAGDIVRILSTASFSPASAAFVKGEMQEVESAVAGTITLKSHLYDSYTAATTTVYKLNMPRIIVQGVKILHNDNNARGLDIVYARDIGVREVNVSGAKDAGIAIDHIFGGSVTGSSSRDAYYTGSGTSYAFLLASSQRIAVIGNHFLSGRHGIAMGGTFPFRDIKVLGNTIDNRHGLNLYCMDAHSNGEFITIAQNDILNGMDVESGNTSVDSNKIRSYDYTYGVMFNLWRSTDFLSFRGNSVINQKTAGNALTVTTSGTDNITVQSFQVDGNPFLHSYQNSILFTTGSGGAMTLTIGVLRFSNTTVWADNFYPFYMASGGGGQVISIPEFHLDGNDFTANRGAYFDFTGDMMASGNRTHAKTNEAYIFDRVGTGNFTGSTNVYDGDNVALGVRFENTGQVQISNYTIKNIGATPLSSTSSVTVFTESGTIYSNVLGANSMSATFYQRVPFYLPTPASTGTTCKKGDYSNDNTYIYTCIADNTWKRAAIATW